MGPLYAKVNFIYMLKKKKKTSQGTEQATFLNRPVTFEDKWVWFGH